MKGEKNTGINKTTVTCILIIVLLIMALIGLVLYYKEKDNNNSNVNLNDNNSIVETNSSIIRKDEENEQITDIYYITEKMNLSHAWIPYKAEDENGNEIKLNEVFGTMQENAGYLIFNEDKTFSEDIILSDGEHHYTGKYSYEKDIISFYTNDGELYWTAKYIMYKNGESVIKKRQTDNKYVYYKNYINIDDSIIYGELVEEEYKKEDYYFILTKIEMNKDDTCTIYGALYKREESPYSIVLVPGMYRKITVKNNTPFVNDYPDIETPNSIIKDLYSEDKYIHEKLYLTVYANSEMMLDFKFSNGKCVEISTINLPV